MLLCLLHVRLVITVLIFRFDTHQNFLDPQLTKDGKPYGPTRFKEIVQELYGIAKNTNTPYTDLLTITPKERDILVECIKETRDALLKQQEELKQKQFE